MPSHPRSEPQRTPSPDAPGPRTARRVHAADWLDRLAPIDLRRPREGAAAELALSRADWLGPEDRALVEAVLRDGVCVTTLARAAGAEPRALRRRFAALVNRLLDERTAFVARAIPAMSATRAKVARGCFLRGQTQREVARANRLSLHTVRAHRQAIQALYELARDGATNIDRTWR